MQVHGVWGVREGEAGTASASSLRIGRIYWEYFLVLPREVCGGIFEGFAYEKNLSVNRGSHV